MSIVRRFARPLLAASFLSGGANALLHPMPQAEPLRPVMGALARPLGLPNDPELLVRANGAVMVGAGTLFALGRMPRLSAALLAASLLPTTYAEHPFWSERDPQARSTQRALFLKNAALLGATVLAAVDTEGRPGLAWRGRHAVTQAEQAGKRAARQARRSSKRATRQARKSAAHARSAAASDLKQARRVARTVVSR